MLQETLFNPFLTVLLLCSWFPPLSICLCCLAAPGVFLICWLPFFVTHILNTHCRTCYVPPGLYSAFTWLGYVNSALNPVIYTTFNIEFRRAFIKILSCWGGRSARKLKWKWGCALMLQLRRGACGSSDHSCALVMVMGHKPAFVCRSFTITARWGKKKNRCWCAINQTKEDFYS